MPTRSTTAAAAPPPPRHRTHTVAWCALALLASCVVGSALLSDQLAAGHDAAKYPPRLTEFILNLADGNIPPRWAPHLSSGYGQPFFIYNPPLTYVIATAISVTVAIGPGTPLTVSPGLVWNLFGLFTVLAAGQAMFWYGRSVSGPAGGFVASAMYVSAPYFVADLYVRSAWAELLAFVWLPLLFLGIVTVHRCAGMRSTLLLGAATAALLLTHNPAALAAALGATVHIVALLIGYRSLRSLPTLATAALLGAGATAYFWLPAIAGTNLIETRRLLTDPGLRYEQHMLSPAEWIVPSWGHTSPSTLDDDHVAVHLGVIHLVLACGALTGIGARTLRSRRARTIDIPVLAAMPVLLLALWLTQPGSDFVWRSVDAIRVFQFPWRFLQLAVLSTALLAGHSVTLLRREHVRLVVAAGSAAIAILVSLPHARPPSAVHATASAFTADRIVDGHLSASSRREYRPRGTPLWPPPAPLVDIVRGSGTVSDISWRTETIRFDLNMESSGLVAVRQFDFPGWYVELNEAIVPHFANADTGAIRFPAPTGQHSVRVVFGSTPLRTAAVALSVVSLLVATWLGVRRRRVLHQ